MKSTLEAGTLMTVLDGVKLQWGGGMRQSGVMATMCLFALDRNLDRLRDDPALAAEIGHALSAMHGIARVLPVETNIVIADLASDAPDAATIAARLETSGLRVGVFGARRLRIVTHLDVDAEAARDLCAALRKLLG